jgi:DNA-binding CsgD family transcriptional regulator
VHLFFILPFIKPAGNTSLLKEIGFSKKYAFLFLVATILYSATTSFIIAYGFISTCISIILIFGTGVFIPIAIRLNTKQQQNSSSMDFKAFCKYYEISKREAEIVLEICSGKSNKGIADKLFITLQTVKDHNHRIYTKTGVKSRVQLSNLVREKMGQ